MSPSDPRSAPSTAQSVTPRVVELADRLERDIDERRLRAGDPYLSAADAARMLRVSVDAANRALQLLVKRGRIERRQRVGAIVADRTRRDDPAGLATVHVLVPESFRETEGLLADGVGMGLEEALRGAEMLYHDVPTVGGRRAVEDLVRQAAKRHEPVGFVLIRSSAGLQRIVSESGLPAVVWGTVHPSIPGLASMDRNHEACGSLLAEHVLRQRRRLLVILRDQVLPGDHAFLDGAMGAAYAHGLQPTDVTLRFMPSDTRVAGAVIREELRSDRAKPGIVCRGEPLALAAHAEARRLRQRAMIACDVYRADRIAACGLVWTAVRETPDEQGHRLGRLLLAQLGSGKRRVRHVVLDVELRAP